MKKVCFVLFFACGVSLARAVLTPPDEVILDRDSVIRDSSGVTAKRFPNADQVMLNDSIMEIVQKDTTAETWDDEYTKVMTEKGRREASSLSLFFMAQYGTAMVHRVELIKPDGRVVTVDHERYSRISIDTSQMGSNIYDPNMKTLTVSIPGVEIGDIRHVTTYRSEQKKRMPDVWCDYMIFEYTSPILKTSYKISMPNEVKLRHKLLRSPVGNTVKAKERAIPGNRTLFSWTIRNVPQIFPEPSMPPMVTQVQRLMLSTIESWRDVSRWYWNLCQPQLKKVTPDMKAKVKELTQGATTRQEKIRRIFRFVSQEIRYMGITTEEVAPGYEPHDVSMTFKNRYGVCRDKAALLVAMLRLAGIPAYPVLIHVGEKRDPDVPMPYFNHAITAVDGEKGGYQLMDSTNEGTRDIFPAYLSDKSYLVAREEGETLLVSPIYPASKNLVRVRTTGTLEGNGSALLKSEIHFEGINDTVYRGYFLRQKAQDRRGFFERLLKARIPGAEVLECEIFPADLQNTEAPLTATVTSRVVDYPVRGGKIDLLNMPWLTSSIGYVNFVIGQTGLQKRKYPFETEIACGVEERVTLNCGEAMGEAYQFPDSTSLSRNGLVFDLSYRLDKGVLTATRRHLVNTLSFSPAQYLDLKEDMKRIEAANRRRPLFVSKTTDRPDQEWLSVKTETRIESPTSWSTVDTWQKRILTYAGKKNNSEIRLPYNPIWQDVEVVSATVSNLNGEVKHLTAKELNLMDAGWVASAPRYPGAKTLVASLPGVEIGSVISVQTRKSQKNGYFYSISKGFGGGSPVAFESYKLTYPKNLKPRIRLYGGEDVLCQSITNGNLITRTWTARDLPAVKSETSQAPWHFFQPTLYLSFGSWEQQAAKLDKALRKARRGSRKARERARKLVKGIRDPRQRILAVRNEVLRTIRVAGPGFLGLPVDTAFSTPDRTLSDQYGHAADRALLLETMLDAAGIDGVELLFASGDRTDYPRYGEPQRDIPQLHYYSAPIVKAKCGGKTILLNEGDQYSELGSSALDKGYALNLNGGIERLRVEPLYQNRGKSEMSIELDERGTAFIAVTNWYFGTSVGPFRERYEEMLPEDRRRHHMELVGGIARSALPVGPLVTETKAYPGFQSYRLRATDFATVEGGTLTFMIPSAAAAFFPFTENTRTTPIFLGSRGLDEWTCRIILPKGYTKEQMVPASRNWKFPNGTGSMNVSVRRENLPDGRLSIILNRRTVNACGEFSPEFYPALLEYNRKLSHPSVKTLIISKEK